MSARGRKCAITKVSIRTSNADLVIGIAGVLVIKINIHVFFGFGLRSPDVLQALVGPGDKGNRLYQSKKARHHQKDRSLAIKAGFFDFTSFGLDGVLRPNQQDHDNEAIVDEPEKCQTQGLEFANIH